MAHSRHAALSPSGTANISGRGHRDRVGRRPAWGDAEPEPDPRADPIGDILRVYRWQAALSIAEGAALIGFSQSTLGAIERGKARVRPRHVRVLLEEYGAPAQVIEIVAGRVADFSVSHRSAERARTQRVEFATGIRAEYENGSGLTELARRHGRDVTYVQQALRDVNVRLRPMDGDDAVNIDGAQLAEARRRRGLSQERLAELSGTTQGGVSYYESGEKKPTREQLDAILDALRVPTSERASFLVTADSDTARVDA